MTLPGVKTHQSGFTLLEVLVGFVITGLVFSAVFTGFSQFMMLTTQDEISQNLREDLLLSMGRVCKDVNLSANVIPRAGTIFSDNTNLALRQPILSASGEILADQFQYVSYTIKNGVQERGLIRQVWAVEDAEEALQTEVVDDSIVALAFLYGGKPIAQVTNLTVIRDLEVVVVSGRKTGLRLPAGATLGSSDYPDLTVLNQLLEYGMDFPTLRSYIDTMNNNRMDVTIAATMGAATMRNKKALGLKTAAAPSSPSS